MAILLLFTAIALAIFIVALAALAWSVRSGQLDDLETPALRMLADDADHRRIAGPPHAASPPRPDVHAGTRPRPSRSTPSPTTTRIVRHFVVATVVWGIVGMLGRRAHRAAARLAGG